MSLKETGLAGGSLQARSDDQLSGSISSENTASPAAAQAESADAVRDIVLDLILTCLDNRPKHSGTELFGDLGGRHG